MDVRGGSDEAEVWATISDEEGSIVFNADGTKAEENATTNNTYDEWLAVLNSPSNYEMSVNTNCGKFPMPYSDGAYSYSDDEGRYVAVELDEGSIIISADVATDCVPSEIIVTKK